MPLDRKPDQMQNKLDPHLGARVLRIVFIPWDAVEGDEWAQKRQCSRHGFYTKTPNSVMFQTWVLY